jgi:hypothetical protein
VLHLNSNNAGDTIKVVLSYRRAARSLDFKSAQVIDQEYLAIFQVNIWWSKKSFIKRIMEDGILTLVLPKAYHKDHY